MENGELRQYDFPGAVETEIYGISDATGTLTGNFTDASGVRRGFSGDVIVEFPGAPETYADFVNASGRMVGSYVDADGLYYSYARTPDGRFISLDLPLPQAAKIEYLFVHGISDAGVVVARGKLVDDVPRTYVGSVFEGLHELKVPGSVRTEGYNINQDASVVGHYDSPDGRRHGFIARPATEEESDYFRNAYTATLDKGLNMLSVPLAPSTPMSAKSLVAMAGATTIIKLDTVTQQFIAWTPSAPDDGFPIEGGQGYIVNVPETRNFAFVGGAWTNQTEAAAAAPTVTPLIRGDRGVAQEAWAFVVSGHLQGKPAFDGYQAIVRNSRTNSTITASVRGGYFAAATADLTRRSVVEVGDVFEVHAIGPNGNVESQTLRFKVTLSISQTLSCLSDLMASVNRHRTCCCRTIRTRLTQRRGFRINLHKTLRYQSPFMIQPVSWFAHFHSVINPQASIIVGNALRIGMDAMPLANALRVGSIFIS